MTSFSNSSSEGNHITTDARHGDDDSEDDELPVHGTDYNENSSLILHHAEPAADRERRRSFIEDEDELQIEILPSIAERKEAPVTWMSLPHKSQLAILVIARLSEPLVQSSLRVCHVSPLQLSSIFQNDF